MIKTTHSIAEYVSKNSERKNKHWRYINGALYFKHEGQWLEEEVFNYLFPQYEYKENMNINPDGTYVC